MPPRRSTRASSKEPNGTPLLSGLPLTNTRRKTRASSKQPETPSQPSKPPPARGSQRRRATRTTRKASEESNLQTNESQEETQSTQEHIVETQITAFSKEEAYENGVQAHVSVKRQVRKQVEHAVENGSNRTPRPNNRAGRNQASSVNHPRVSIHDTTAPEGYETEILVDEHTHRSRRQTNGLKIAQKTEAAASIEQAKKADDDVPYEPNPLFERPQDEPEDPVRQRKRRAWMARGHLSSKEMEIVTPGSRETSAGASSSKQGDSDADKRPHESKSFDTESMDEDVPEADHSVADLEREMRIAVERREAEQQALLSTITESMEEERTEPKEIRTEEETPSTPVRRAPAATAATAPQPERNFVPGTPHAVHPNHTPRTSVIKSMWDFFSSPFSSSQPHRPRPITRQPALVAKPQSSHKTSSGPSSEQIQAAADPSHDMARASARRHALREDDEADAPRRRKMPGGWDGEESGTGSAQVGLSPRNKLPPWVLDLRNPGENLPDIPIRPYDPAYQYKETFPGSGIPDINVISWRANLAKFMPLSMKYKPDQRLKYFLYSFGNEEQKKLVNMAPFMRWYCPKPEVWKRWLPGFQSFDDFTVSKRLDLLRLHWGDMMRDRANAVFDDKFVKNFRTFNVAPIAIGPGLENAMDTAPASASTVSLPTATPRPRAGTYSVPDDDDDDDEDNDASIVNKATEQRKTGHVPGTSTFTVPEGDDDSSDDDDDMPDTPTKQSWPSKPPPRPTPAHATLPTTPATPAAPLTTSGIPAPPTAAAGSSKVVGLFSPAAESALDRARANAQKHKPLNSSRLARVSPERAFSNETNGDNHATNSYLALAKLTQAVASANASAPELSFGSLSPDEDDEVMNEVMKIPLTELPMDLFGQAPKLGPQPHADEETRMFVDKYWADFEAKDNISKMAAAEFAHYINTPGFVPDWAQF